MLSQRLTLFLRLSSNEQRTHPGQHDRILERTIIRCAPRHRIRIALASSSIAAQTSPLPLSLVLRTPCSEGGHQTRVAVPGEQEQRRALWGRSVACSVVRWSFRFVAVVYRALLLLSLLVSGGGGRGTAEVSVFVSAASSAMFWFSVLSGLSALGVVTVMG